METIPDNIINKILYKKVKKDAKQKFKRFPSLYASSWITSEYIKRGGKYNNNKTSGQKQWYKEKWIQIMPYLEKNKIIKCGDDNKDTKACRPLIRVNKSTPPTIGEIVKKYGNKKVLILAKKKNNDMKGRLNWKNCTFTPSK